MIIGITGMPGAGKTTVAKMLTRRGFALVEMGSIVREEIVKKGLEPSRENMQSFSFSLRRKYGNAAVAMITEKVIKKKFKNRNVVVSGIRSVSEARYLKRYAKMVLIGVVAPVKLRYARLHSRNRSDDPSSFAKFLSRERFERRLGVQKILKFSDIIIANTSTTANLRSDVSSALKRIESINKKS